MDLNEMTKTPLWKARSKRGERYYRATLKGKKIFIFENSFKKSGTNQPDAYLYETKKEIKPGAFMKLVKKIINLK
jgi:hypothetical protein